MGHSAAVWDYRAAIEITKDWNGIDQVSLHGGQVTSWRIEKGEELLFTTSKAIFKPPKAIRGGIPICFPQFGNCGSLEQHGFARNKLWIIDDNPPPLHPNDSDENSLLIYFLNHLKKNRSAGPIADGDLTLISRVRNINGKPFSFSFAYHTYLSVSDISEVRIEGLETLDYLDKLRQREI